jgi:hypothetical protein
MLNDARFQIYFASFVLSSLAGLACQFRLRKITLKGCASAMLNSGLCGLAITLVGLTTVAAKYPEALLGFSVITGLGGMKTIEFVEEVGREAIAALLQSAAKKMISGKGDRKDEDQ